MRRVRVILAGLGHVVIHADVVGSGGDRAGARRGTPGRGGKISPLGAVASLGGVQRRCMVVSIGLVVPVRRESLLVILCRSSDA